MLVKMIRSEAIVPVFDEAADAATAKVAAAETAAAATKVAEEAAAAKAAGGGDKSFTQAEVNTVLADQKRKMQKAQTETIEELEALKAKAELTTTERNELETRIKSMKQANMTAEELAKQERRQTDTEHSQLVETLTGDRDQWKNRYTNATISRSITDASVEHDALVPEQIIAILRPGTQLEEVLDAEGKKTGNYIPQVSFEITDEDGQSKTLKLTVSKAVEKMREIQKYQNLFKIEGQGGLGQYNKSGNKGGGQVDVKKLAQNPEAYRKARAAEEEAKKT